MRIGVERAGVGGVGVVRAEIRAGGGECGE